MAGLLAAVFGAGVLAWIVFAFNRLIRLRNQVRAAWADLVPQLVAAVKGYADHEQSLLATVTTLRAEAAALKSPARLGEVETALEQALGRLFALKEAYPDLRASENFSQLQRDLVAVEEQLQYARRFYNGAVRDYNDAVQRVPDLLVAKSAGFVPAEFFQAGEGERNAVAVKVTS